MREMLKVICSVREGTQPNLETDVIDNRDFVQDEESKENGEKSVIEFCYRMRVAERIRRSM
jgi:hypothetical protein